MSATDKTLKAIALTIGLVLLLGGCVANPTPILAPATATQPLVAYGPVEPSKAPQTKVPTATLSSSGQAVAPTAQATPKPNATPTQSPTKASRPKPPKKGAPAYEFSLSDLEGNRVALSDFRGKKVMLNFWATWCGPCRREIPHMVKLYGELYDQGFEIVAVNLREDPAKVARFVEQFKMNFPILLDKYGQVGGEYYVRAIPTSIFLDEAGIIQAVHRGTLTETALRNYVEALMQ